MGNADRFINRHKSRVCQGNRPAGAAPLHVATAAKAVPRPQNGLRLSDKDRLMIVALDADMNRLQRIQSHAARDVLKRDELLGRYTEYLNGLIQQDRATTPEIIFRNMIWAIDVEQVDWAMTLGLFAIKHGIDSPEGFRRDIRNAFAGDMARLALNLQKAGKPAHWIRSVHNKSQHWDLIDEIRSDVLKATAADAESCGNPTQALDLYRKAIEVYPRCRVTRLITRLEKQLKSEGDRA